MKFISDLSYKLLGNSLTFKLKYFHNRGRFPNLKNPKDLSERVLAFMASPDFANVADYVDKVKVRDYVKSKGLENILLKHYGVWDKPEDIDFDSLPNKFILKANNGAGGHVICRDKSKLDRVEAIKQLKSNLERGSNVKGEMQYKKIEPKVFCEELLELGSDKFPTDYKFHCMNGVPHMIFVGVERETQVKIATFDLNWNELPYVKKESRPLTSPAKPKYLDKMIDYAKKLSEDFDIVRVDLYEHNGNVYFGELTFSPDGGIMSFFNNKCLKEIGNKFKD